MLHAVYCTFKACTLTTARLSSWQKQQVAQLTKNYIKKYDNYKAKIHPVKSKNLLILRLFNVL